MQHFLEEIGFTVQLDEIIELFLDDYKRNVLDLQLAYFFAHLIMIYYLKRRNEFLLARRNRALRPKIMVGFFPAADYFLGADQPTTAGAAVIQYKADALELAVLNVNRLVYVFLLG